MFRKIYNIEDDIAAVSTAPGEGAIGIIRLSGKKVFKIADKVFVSKDGKKPSQFKTHTIHYGFIMNELKHKQRDGKKNSKPPRNVVDEVLLTILRAPKTYTRQDMVEINCHGGVLALKKTLELILAHGARLAEPGEFTKRAFITGRIDLAQAEAVLDVIRAKTLAGLEAALGQLKGRLSEKVSEIKDALVEILANMEASFNFSQEDIDLLDSGKIESRLKAVKEKLEFLIKTSEKGCILREGIMTVICGKPNVGKSSLMNAFLREDKVIVTPIAGTTRDVIEDIINIGGIPIKIVDTAGIIEPRDLVEKESITRSKKCLKEADLILFLLDNSRPLNKEDFQIADIIKDKPVIVVINKIDLPNKLSLEKIKNFLNNKKVVKLCAVREIGLPQLEDAVKEYVFGKRAVTGAESALVTNLRQKKALEEGLEYVKTALENAGNRNGEELIAEDVKGALKFIGQVCGEVDAEDILNKIFEDFCIGK